MKLPFDFGPLLLASFFLAFANAISHGTYSEPALVLIVAGLGTLGWRYLKSPRAADVPPSSGRPTLVLALVLVGLLSMPVTSFFDQKLIAHPHGPIHLVRYVEIASFLLLLTYLPFLSGRPEPPRLKAPRFALFGALMLIGGLATIHISPAPVIDVWTIQMRGAEALLAGHNPYTTVTVPDTDPENTMAIPYVYPPTALYFAALGILLGKDVRYAMLLSVFVAGLALRLITHESGLRLPSIAKDAPALFVWLTPLLFLILELSWIDPVQVMLICVGVAAHVSKKPVLTAIAFGVALSSKQSMFWLIPLVGFVLRFKFREWAIMSITAFALVCPFMILDFKRLKYCNFDFISSLPPRKDALALAVWYGQVFQRPFPSLIAFLFAAGSVAFACLRLRGSVAGFARAAAFTYLVFFFFNKWAFANYYFLLTCLCALAAATSLHAARSASRDGISPKNVGGA